MSIARAGLKGQGSLGLRLETTATRSVFFGPQFRAVFLVHFITLRLAAAAAAAAGHVDSSTVVATIV